MNNNQPRHRKMAVEKRTAKFRAQYRGYVRYTKETGHVPDSLRTWARKGAKQGDSTATTFCDIKHIDINWVAPVVEKVVVQAAVEVAAPEAPVKEKRAKAPAKPRAKKEKVAA